MRVVIDTTYALRGHSGTGVYLANLADALRAEGIDVVEVADDGRPPPAGGGAGSARNLARDTWWTEVALPRRARAARADVLHHPLPALAGVTSCPQVVTIHDLAFARLPECFAPAFRRWASLTHRRAARGADAVICVSETTRRDALARWGVDPARVVVAPHGPGQVAPAAAWHGPGQVDPAAAPHGPGQVDHVVAPHGPGQVDPAAAPATEPPAHFLYVGDDEPRKNLPLLLAAHARYREKVGASALPLILAGTSAAVAQPGVRHEPDPDLSALLRGAAALVHPALHEGFGLTALEAMAAGTPVIAARSPGLVETCEQAALYVDPYDVDGLAARLESVATDPELRARLAAAGLQRAAAFSWRASARAHIEAYTLARDG